MLDYLLEAPCEPEGIELFCPECHERAHLNVYFKIQCDNCERAFKLEEPDYLEDNDGY